MGRTLLRDRKRARPWPPILGHICPIGIPVLFRTYLFYFGHICSIEASPPPAASSNASRVPCASLEESSSVATLSVQCRVLSFEYRGFRVEC